MFHVKHHEAPVLGARSIMKMRYCEASRRMLVEVVLNTIVGREDEVRLYILTDLPPAKNLI